MTMTLTRAKGGPRGCGAGRQAGHIYMETGFPPGMPIEPFLVDLPTPINPDHFGLCAQGITLMEQGGVHHVIDIIGVSGYPEPSDFIEEARQMGISRKIPRNAEFEKLTRDSMLILIHPLASLENVAALAPYAPNFSCPCGHGHAASEPCAGWYWHLAPPEASRGSSMVRKVPSGFYPVESLSPGAPTPQRRPAIMMRIPISNLAVIKNATGLADPQSLSLAQRSALPVFTPDY